MLLCIVMTPLIVFFTLSLFGGFLGHKGSGRVASAFMLGNALFSFVAFYYVGLLGQFTYICFGTWIDCGLLVVNWGFMFDSLAVSMFVVVNTVSSLVHVYSVFYMEKDAHVTRFMSYLSLFTFFMLVLVSADNFLQLFLGWEGVGLCSYLLINFWFSRVQSNKAAMKAMIMNRVGDFGLTFAILLIFFYFKSLDFGVVFLLAPLLSEFFFTLHFNLFLITLSYNVHVVTLICFFLFMGAVGKSAQVGLHTWLPDAMEGPTPVSALIHAATMVTAGVFLIVRCSPLFEYAPSILTLMVFIGAVTSFFAATVGGVQNDIKKIIAYSTCSQLGYMVFACGLSGYAASFFHLVNHAFFKALLFLSAGAVIHSLSGEQDIRRMGGLAKVLPLTYSLFLVGSLSLAGFPFLSGFYSKDFILEVAYSKYTVSSHFVFWLSMVTGLMSSFYSARLVYLVFITECNLRNVSRLNSIHEMSLGTALPLLVLCVGSVFSGFFFKDVFIGLGTPFFKQAIFVRCGNTSCSEFIPISIKLIPTLFSLVGALMSCLFYRCDLLSNFGYRRNVHRFLSNRWNIDTIYNYYFSVPFLNFCYNRSFVFLDQNFFKNFGPLGVSRTAYSLSRSILSPQKGLVYNYAFCLCYALLLFLIVYWV